MMKSLLYLLFGMLLSMASLLAADTIEKGDTLKIYVIDNRGSDIVMGRFSQDVLRTMTQDPHDFVVSLEGKVFVPNVGMLDVLGLTTQEVEKLIVKKLSSRNPAQEVAVLNMTAKYKVVYIAGEVSNPGMYKLNYTKPSEARLLSAISLTGGFTTRADKEHITVIKENGATRELNLSNMVNSLAVKENVELENNDTIIVPQSVGRVYVLGETVTPGGYPFISGANFLDYIAEAGGVKSSAAYDNIGIVRKERGTYNVYKVGLRGDLVTQGKSIDIKPGDIIYLQKSFFADWKDLSNLLGIVKDSYSVYDSYESHR